MRKFKDNLSSIAGDYFNHMARSYPVMCSSDEFYFFPRAKKALNFIGNLDNFNKDKIGQDIAYVKKLRNEIEKVDSPDLETQIDIQVLRQSMSSFLREFEKTESWRLDPSIYLKVSLLGIDQLLNKLVLTKPKRKNAILSRLEKIPALLKQARINLVNIPELSREISLEMVDVSIDYFKRDLSKILKTYLAAKDVSKLLKQIIISLTEFKDFLQNCQIQDDYPQDELMLADLLFDSFSYKRDLKEIFQIAQDEYENTLKEMRLIALKIDARKNWQQIVNDYKLNIKNSGELIKLYSTQIARLKNFIIKEDVISIHKTQAITVNQTPAYLMPIRASASYSSPLTKNPKEKGVFYVTVYFGKEKTKQNFDNVHHEYMFVSAHETYPGHHLLDSMRRSSKNVIRSQVESALFYEGWASYAERLMDRLRFIDEPVQRLIGLRRQAWRCIRAMLDVGASINRIQPEDAAAKLSNLGYNPHIVKQMLRHYRLTCGYQLCYTMGKFEIERLRKKFERSLGTREFHDCLLEGGQIPFDLLERRLEALNEQ